MPPQPAVPTSRDDITLDWLNTIFIPQGYKIVCFAWEGQANNGVGVMSTLERMSLDLESGGKLTIILKTLPPKDSPLRNFTVCNRFAERELKMYTNLFVQWDEFLKAQNVREAYHYRRPICYYAASSGDSYNEDTYDQILILEDLFTSGFKMWPEGYGKSLGWDEAKPCIRLLALFHAVGLAYKKMNGIDNYNIPFPFLIHDMVHDKDMMEYFLKGGFDVIHQMMVKYGRIQEESLTTDQSVLKLHPMPPGLREHLKVLQKHALRNLEHLNPTGNQMGTVIHQDAHVNNFMFRDKGSGISGHEVVFFDFQASMYCMPMKDLSFFLIQNCEDSLLTTQFSRSLQYYHDVLHEALQSMGVPLEEYTMDWMMEEYRSMAYLSIIHIIAGGALLFGENVADDSKRRFYNRIVQMFNDGLLQCVLYPD